MFYSENTITIFYDYYYLMKMCTDRKVGKKWKFAFSLLVIYKESVFAVFYDLNTSTQKIEIQIYKKYS